jgi:integrase
MPLMAFTPDQSRSLPAYRAIYQLGSTARLVRELMLNLGVRRPDLVRLGPSNLINGRIEFTPQKGASKRANKPLRLPLPRPPFPQSFEGPGGQRPAPQDVPDHRGRRSLYRQQFWQPDAQVV